LTKTVDETNSNFADVFDEVEISVFLVSNPSHEIGIVVISKTESVDSVRTNIFSWTFPVIEASFDVFFCHNHLGHLQEEGPMRLDFFDVYHLRLSKQYKFQTQC